MPNLGNPVVLAAARLPHPFLLFLQSALFGVWCDVFDTPCLAFLFFFSVSCFPMELFSEYTLQRYPHLATPPMTYSHPVGLLPPFPSFLYSNLFCPGRLSSGLVSANKSKHQFNDLSTTAIKQVCSSHSWHCHHYNLTKRCGLQSTGIS